MKKMTSFGLLILMILCLIPFPAVAAQEKDGFTLVPTLYGKSGVDVGSTFILTAPDTMQLDALASALSIDGQPMPDIAHKGGKEFIITPVVALSPNALYLFRLARDGKDDITWAFQTAKKFMITSSFPRNQATNVPKNSGIEITFSDEGYTPIAEYFNISPTVEGRFEYHKNTAVFVPKALDYKTVYTVTIQAGIKLNGSNDVLTEDYQFAFETEAEPAYTPPQYVESVYFYSRYAELPSVEAPRVRFRINYARDTALPNPKVNVYQFSDSEKALEAIKALTRTPSWSRYAKEEDLINPSGLRRVMAFDAKDTYDETGSYLSLPDTLTQGFYLIDATLGKSRDQTIVQINDLPVQVIADQDKAIFWVNDIRTGKASAGATVQDNKEGKDYQTDANGIAVIDRMLTPSRDYEAFTIRSTDGKTCVWFYNGYGSGAGNQNEAYWTALQLDRNLFKHDDSVSFFGFVQNRRNNEVIRNVSVILTQAYGFGYFGTGDVLHRQTVSVENGAYSDELVLPNVEVGSYNLTVYHGDVALGSTYFTVRDYVKPPYQMELSADRKAAFVDETVTFSAKAGFFEGTPVADLDISYRLSGSRLMTSGNGQGTTNLEGRITVSEEITAIVDAQGQTSLSFTAEATLPEIGRTTKSASVRVFINDIAVAAQAKRTDRNATLTVNVHTITLDRINAGTAKDYNDYLDAPVANQSLSAEVYRIYYEKVERGEYYDYIEKKVMPIYWHTRKEERISRFTLVTDKNGIAERNFTVPNREYESYRVDLSCFDSHGREMTQSRYIGYDYTSYWSNANTNTYFLDGGDGSYAIEEEVQLTLKRGTDTVTKGNFLFVTMQRGIQSWQAGKNPYSFTFTDEHIPNIIIHAYYFNGYSYQSSYYMSKTIRFDYAQNALSLTAAMDKSFYKPGDRCSIILTARDSSGKGIEANVNISIVDEALFALQDYTVDTLTALYRMVGSGLRFAAATHRTYVPTLDEDILADETPAGVAPSPMAPEAEYASGEETYLREVFKDTAFFGTLKTDRNGKAVFTFPLPDNITSWRLTMSGISNDLYAGNGVQNILVTNPMFISYTLNDEFLVGDVPAIGVNVYGTSLTGRERVEFEVWDENNPDELYKANGVAFERINIPLWEMKKEGANALIIKATVSNGTSDAVKHPYQVLQTYREMDEAVYYEVSPDTVFDVGNGGLTNITFTDQGRGALLRQLFYLGSSASGGDRIEKMLVRREADKLIQQYFPDVYLRYSRSSFDPKRYQQSDGGISILPYAESDLATTLKGMPYIKDEVNIYSLKNYLYQIYEGENAENKMGALYGLSLLKEPVLLDLNNYAMLDGLSVKDAVYIALGYCALGERETASQLYDDRIAPKLEQITPYYRVNTGVDQDDILEATSAANLLATKLEKPEKEGLYQYCVMNYATDLLINIEKLSYIEQEMGKRTEVKGSIKYTLFGEEFSRNLGNGGSYTLRIPAQNMKEFKLLEVTGEVGAVSVYTVPMIETGEMDPDISVRRRYYKAEESESSTTFEEGDLVRVQLWIDYSKKAIDGSYCVTDYLPAGLAYVSDSAKIGNSPYFGYRYYRYCVVEGQKIMFYDYNGRFDKGYLYYYYARVISPGTFTAEGPLVQNLGAKEYYTVGEDSLVVIQ